MKLEFSVQTSLRAVARALILILFFLPTARAEISNRLPVGLVRELTQGGLWDDELDSPRSMASQDFNRFLDSLKDSQAVSTVVDNIFGTNDGDREILPELPRQYQVKVATLRYFLAATKDERARYKINDMDLRKIEAAWMRRYLFKAGALIRLTGIHDYDAIADRFNQMIQSGAVTVMDLSPSNRKVLAKKMGTTHGINLNDRQHEKFLVNGLYSREQKLFVLDFSMGREETLVTFAHEIVHAADPMLEKHRSAFERLEPEVEKILGAALGVSDGVSDIIRNLISHIFYESDADILMSLAEKSRRTRHKGLTSSAEETLGKLSASETKTIGEWIRAGIGVSIENEYRAYGLSLMAYEIMKSRLHLMAPSPEREAFVKQMIAGDKLFATKLSLAMSPFAKSANDFVEVLVKSEKDSAKQNMLRIKSGKILSLLEYVYLSQTQDFLESLNDHFSAVLHRSVAPEWLQPRHLKSPASPYQVLSARLTTAWVLRFRENVSSTVRYLKNMNESLFAMRAGILDLHDIALGELKLLGIHYEDTGADILPSEISQDLHRDLNELPSSFQRYFETTKRPMNATDSEALEGLDVARNLTLLRLLKGLAWLDESFPSARNNLVAIKVFLQQIHDGLYDADEISRGRAAELENELLTALKAATLTPAELDDAVFLAEALVNMYAIAQEQRWEPVAEQFLSKARMASRIIEDLGINHGTDIVDIQARINQAVVNFRRQLETLQRHCQQYRQTLILTPTERFTLGAYQIPLTIVCASSTAGADREPRMELHMIRQPGDYQRSMTTMTFNGRPQSRIFTGARPVRLYPLQTLNPSSLSKNETGADN
jgi:hypothetical protein